MKFIKKQILILILYFLIINPIKANKGNKSHIKIYSHIKTIYTTNNNKLHSQNNNLFFFGIKGKTKNNKYINAFGKIEGSIKSNILNNKNYKKNQNNNLDINLAYIGLYHKNIGSITYGKNFGVLYNSLSFTNIFPYNQSKFIRSNLSTNIINNVITYKKKFVFKNNKFIKNISIITQYQGKNNQGNSLEGIIDSTNGGWGIAYSYQTPYGIDLASSYSNYIHDYRQERINDKFIIYGPKSRNAKAWSSSIRYHVNNLYIATSYSKGINFTPIYTTTKSPYYGETLKRYNFSKKSQNISIVIKYKFKNGITPMFGYIQTIAHNLDKTKIGKNIFTPSTIDLEKYFNLGVTYKFNNSLFGYIDYKINQLTKNNILRVINNEENLISLGLIYKF